MKAYFTVTLHHDGQSKGFDISIGAGKKFKAENLQEVVYGLQHYFRESIPEYPFDYQKHIDHAKECGCCPLCKG